MSESPTAEQQQLAVTHPSGWWKGSDCKWYRPDEQPAPAGPEATTDDGGRDLISAMGMTALAVLAVLALPRLLPARSATAIFDVTLLFAGTAGAFLTRWWVFTRTA
jgi:hypothetical protein